MATKFLEPGGDADFLVGTTNGFWRTAAGAIATDFVHGGHLKSISFTANGGYGQQNSTAVASIADAGARISLYLYVKTLPGATSSFLRLFKSDGSTSVVELRLTSGGVLQLWNGTSAQIGSNGATLSTATWYRISLAFTITSTSVNRFEVFKDAVSTISVTNATITNTATSMINIGTVASNPEYRMSDFYIDDSSALTDTGDVWVTAKRPLSNGTLNQWTTQIGAGGSGYGSGHAPQVNERALSTTNGWSIAGDAINTKTEEYSIEGKSVGDIDISAATIVDFVGWVSANATNTQTDSIVVAGVSSNISLTTTVTLFTQVAGSTTYPAGNTDIGIIQPISAAITSKLYECGILVAYKPAAAVVTPPFQETVTFFN